MAYTLGAAIKGIWGFVFPRDLPHPQATPEDPTTTHDDDGPVPVDIPQAYSNHSMHSAARAPVAQPPTPTEAQKENPADKIPWLQIHYAHISNLRGQLRYLKLIGDKNNCADKVEEYIQRTRQALYDAKAAAAVAGIIPSSSNPAPSKRRRSVTFASDVEVLVQKKVKVLPASTATIPRYSKRTIIRDPPSIEKLAELTSSLGKHTRASPEAGIEEEGTMSEKATKRNRVVYLEKKYWKPCQYEGDVTDDEDEDEDDADFAPMPDDIGSSSSGSSKGSSPASSEGDAAAKDESAAPVDAKSTKGTTEDKEKISTASEKGEDAASTIEEPKSPLKSTKHTTQDEAPNPLSSAKKHKKNHIPRVIEDSSKRRAEHTEEEPAEAVLGGNMKKQKRV